MDAIKEEKFYASDDYHRFNDDKRREIINGSICLISPAPNREHQEVLFNLSGIFYNYLKYKKCRAYFAPFDVCLSKEGETKTAVSNVVQPDMALICDKTKIDRHGCFGSPDLIVEILSPATSKRDMTEKYNLYQEHKVPEYWVVDPLNQIISRFLLDETANKYRQAEYFDRKDVISPIIFADFIIKLEEVFPSLEEAEADETVKN